MDIQHALAEAIEQLKSTSDSPQADASTLLAFALDKPRSYLLTWPEKELSTNTQNHFLSLVNKRLQGEPIAYLTGQREFWSLNLYVSPATLIPRPETELLVELALAQLPLDQTSKALDLGTGSGAIALAIASERPRCEVLAVDCSQDALAVAEKNRNHLNIHNLQLSVSHWFDNIKPQTFDVIVSNPPYIAPNDPHLSQGDLRFEPSTALSADQNGLADLIHIAEKAKDYLKPGGWLMMEHGYDQREALIDILTTLGYHDVIDHEDFGGQARTICGRLPEP